MAELYFLFSGEHRTLPASELKAILEAEGYQYEVLEQLDQTLRLKTDLDCVTTVKRRAALTKICGLELFSCKAETDEIVGAASYANLHGVLRSTESFAVRVKRVKNYASKIDSLLLESKLGQIVLEKTKAEVNLENPDKTFFGILTDEKFIFGVELAEILPTPFMKRQPKNKPFFHPSAMPAKLARCMVNLAQPKGGELVFDPFCGTGSMLIEAALVGCRVLGSDIKRKMVAGAFQNLGYFSIEPEGVIVADARNLPVSKVDCVVTDPPYGRSATTVKRGTRQIVEEVLTSVDDLLDVGRRVCMAAPKPLNIGRIGTDLGYNHLESHMVYVHRSLTREIAVFEKV